MSGEIIQVQIGGLCGEVAQLRERMAHLEGLLEGLREAISGRVKASGESVCCAVGGTRDKPTMGVILQVTPNARVTKHAR